MKQNEMISLTDFWSNRPAFQILSEQLVQKPDQESEWVSLQGLEKDDCTIKTLRCTWTNHPMALTRY